MVLKRILSLIEESYKKKKLSLNKESDSSRGSSLLELSFVSSCRLSVPSVPRTQRESEESSPYIKSSLPLFYAYDLFGKYLFGKFEVSVNRGTGKIWTPKVSEPKELLNETFKGPDNPTGPTQGGSVHTDEPLQVDGTSQTASCVFENRGV